MLTTFADPGLMFLMFLVLAIITRFFMQPVTKRRFLSDKADGDFRYSHLLLKENVESVALQNGIERERKNIDQKFSSLLSANWSLVVSQYYLSLVTNLGNTKASSFYSYSIATLCFYFGFLDVSNLKEADRLTTVGMIVGLNMLLMNNWFGMLDFGSALANNAGNTARLSQMKQVFDELSKPRDNCPRVSEETSSFESLPLINEEVGERELNPKFVESENIDFDNVRYLNFENACTKFSLLSN